MRLDEGSEIEGSLSDGEITIDVGLFSKEEARVVQRSKLLVYLVLVLAGIGVALAAYHYTIAESKSAFLYSFQAKALEVIEETDNSGNSIFATVHSMSVAYISLADNTKSHWPNVTDRNFNSIVEDAIEHVQLDAVIFAPLVHQEDKEAFEAYASLNQGLLWTKGIHKDSVAEGLLEDSWTENVVVEFDPIHEKIQPLDSNIDRSNETPDFYVPIWHFGPNPRNSSIVLTDLYTHPVLRRAIDSSLHQFGDALSDTFDADFILQRIQHVHDDSHTLGSAIEHESGLRSMYLQPILSNFTIESEIVGFIGGVISWEALFSDMFQADEVIDLVVEQSCGDTFTFRIIGPRAQFVGLGSLQEPEFSYMAIEAPLFQEYVDPTGNCYMKMIIYATKEFKDSFDTKEPLIYTSMAVMIFLFTAAVFVFYDIMVQKQLKHIHATAIRSNAVVTSLFPKKTAQLLIEQAEAQKESAAKNRFFRKEHKMEMSAKPTDDVLQMLRSSVGASHYVQENIIEGRPLADLFPSATVMFADMAGFTAWSSAREPNQVFVLLETIYGAFDKIAKSRRVFKVETIGDCYVAVCGLPEPRNNHEVVMARFAHECIEAMAVLVQQLEVKLGPETAELGLRVGLHTGSVTAGVLRGDKARFQLFGDTVNVTARIESSGSKNRTHVSKETAKGIIRAGKGHWLQKRQDIVFAKGKGALETYWLQVSDDTRTSAGDSDVAPTRNAGDASDHLCKIAPSTDRHSRLNEWACGLLATKLQKVVAVRTSIQSKPVKTTVVEQKTLGLSDKDYTDTLIRIPEYRAPLKVVEWNDIDLGENVLNQLRDLVQNIASMYRDNPFHNMEHAAHVANSVVKLFHATFEGKGLPDVELDNQTFGISSDPMMRFAVVLAAIIHDMDHEGVPNTQLIKEGKGHGKSIAEVHSLTMAWELLMQDKYKDLRATIYTTQEEYNRFRSVFISAVLSTDIMDKDWAAARRERWESAFSEGFFVNVGGKRHNRATILIEHLMQASDVAHTMQHWHLYRKWNERLFHEMYNAYKEGRAEMNPCDFWYEGELGFLKNYVMPLATKLRDCGVYGSIGEEYLRYAELNQTEWELKGQSIVQDMVSQHVNRKPERPGDKYMI